MNTARRRFAAASLVALALILPGCYKSQYEAAKTQADDLDKKLKDTQSQLDQSKSELASSQGRVQQLEMQLSGLRAGGTLVGFVDGKPTIREAIRWDGTQWVRHGDSSHGDRTIKFENGRLADQVLFINQAGGRPWYTGAIKYGKPDGEWIWFDTAGKPSMRETWTAGRLVEVARASTSKGPLSWSKLGTKDRETWVKTSTAALTDLPELVRDTTAPTPPPTAAAPAAKPAAKPASTTKKPAGKTGR